MKSYNEDEEPLLFPSKLFAYEGTNYLVHVTKEETNQDKTVFTCFIMGYLGSRTPTEVPKTLLDINTVVECSEKYLTELPRAAMVFVDKEKYCTHNAFLCRKAHSIEQYEGWEAFYKSFQPKVNNDSGNKTA